MEWSRFKYIGLQAQMEIMPKIRKVKPAWLWIFVFTGALILHLWSLARYPAPFVDEVWLISRAEGLIQTGHQFGVLDNTGIINLPGMWTLNQWLITFLQAVVLRFFPQPELIPVRVLALFFGSGLLGASYWTAWRLGGRKLALASTLLLALSPAFFYSGHQARYDILAAALDYLALALVINNQRGRFWIGALGGIALGLGIETHLNSLIFLPVFGTYFLVEYGKTFIRRAACWGFAFGLSLGAVLFLVLHVLPFPQTYFQANLLLFGKTQQPPLLTWNVLEILKNLGYTGGLLLGGVGSLVLVGILAIPGIIQNKSKKARHLLFLNLSLFISAALIMPNKSGWYAILLAPPIVWLSATGLLDFLARPWRRSLVHYVYSVTVLAAVAGMVALSASFLTNDGYHGYQEMQAKVNAAVKPGDTIIGPQIYWLGLHDHPYYSWELLYIYPRFIPGSSLADVFANYNADIFIMDSGMEITFLEDADPSSRKYYYSLSKKDLFNFLDQNSNKILDEYSDTYGWVRVYRITGAN
jgi:4-amino-4-deoxy-L-arabinose transferase-like glycosyltransferase